MPNYDKTLFNYTKNAPGDKKPLKIESPKKGHWRVHFKTDKAAKDFIAGAVSNLFGWFTHRPAKKTGSDFVVSLEDPRTVKVESSPMIDRVMQGETASDVVDELTSTTQIATRPKSMGVVKKTRKKDESVDEKSGDRFKDLVGKLKKDGVKDPSALAAWIGRKKYGAAKMKQLATKGRK